MKRDDEVLPTEVVPVADLPVVDLPRHEVVGYSAVPARDRARLVFALHVGGLLHLDHQAFRAALTGADVLYADGAAVVLLARLAGARRIERAPTTDIGAPVLREVSRRLGRPARVALVGGPPGLAGRAGEVLVRSTGVDVVATHSGYFTDDAVVLDLLRHSRPDVVVLGLGMPKEAVWAHQHSDALPRAVVLTCGGWFGFLTGAERRAPRWLQTAGLEWTYRLYQQFPRLAGRYARGAVRVARLAPRQMAV
ncbi:WecB/TagA/CpsF family glycosyltransferase, partial [Janibacter corallicola]|uniref:WecB/TagA/CpsF family glycosyltransferase n=1 Tax=Janibacter corallicola TaxID=415212 RepID=UPI0012ED7DB2